MNTNTHPLHVVLSNFARELSQNLPQSPADPRLATLAEGQFLAHQLAIIQQLNRASGSDPANRAASNAYLKALILMEKTRTRLARGLGTANPKETTIQREDALRFLTTELSSGPRPAAEMITAARKLGISQRTLIRAKEQLGIISTLIYDENKIRSWVWSYPPETNTPETTPANSTPIEATLISNSAPSSALPPDSRNVSPSTPADAEPANLGDTNPTEPDSSSTTPMPQRDNSATAQGTSLGSETTSTSSLEGATQSNITAIPNDAPCAHTTTLSPTSPT